MPAKAGSMTIEIVPDVDGVIDALIALEDAFQSMAEKCREAINGLENAAVESPRPDVASPR